MTREEFEARQAVTLYREKSEKAGLIWEETLSGITSMTHIDGSGSIWTIWRRFDLRMLMV